MKKILSLIITFAIVLFASFFLTTTNAIARHGGHHGGHHAHRGYHHGHHGGYHRGYHRGRGWYGHRGWRGYGYGPRCRYFAPSGRCLRYW